MHSRSISHLCLFCGSSTGNQPQYETAAREFGAALAAAEITIVYGGGRIGLMGALADAALAAGGKVIGVIPHSLMLKEVGHPGLTELRIVDTMHERKAMLADMADGFVALPGGLGTFEEILEIITWLQLGIHRKPCGFFNVANFYDRLIEFLDHAAGEGFLRLAHREMILVESDPAAMLHRMRAFIPPTVERWITRDER